MVSAGQPTILVRNAEVDGCGGVDIRVGPNRIEQVGIRLGAHPGDQVLDAAGGAVIPGLHDHHVHLRAVVAARASVDVSAAPDAAAFDRLIAAAALTATPGRWLRVTGWHEQRAGWLDRARLDALAGTVPIRVQHRTGVMWVMNSAALHAAGAGDCDLDGVERDRDGAATGRLLRMDAWLRTRLTAIGADYGSVGFADGLAAYAEACAQLGITGFTDATPGRDQADVDEFCQLSAAGAFAQRLILMAPPGLKHPASGRVTLGPMKVVLDDTTLPTVAELALRITDAHGLGVAVAVHCVTAEQLVVSVAAFQQAGPAPAGKADRIEHAAVVPRGLRCPLRPSGSVAGRGRRYRPAHRCGRGARSCRAGGRAGGAAPIPGRPR